MFQCNIDFVKTSVCFSLLSVDQAKIRCHNTHQERRGSQRQACESGQRWFGQAASKAADDDFNTVKSFNLTLFRYP